MNEETSTQLTAKQKMRLYLVTLAVVSALYVAPMAFHFLSSLPKEVWMASFALIGLFWAVILIIAVFAIWQVFRTGRKAIGGLNINVGGLGKGKKGPIKVGSWSSEEDEDDA